MINYPYKYKKIVVNGKAIDEHRHIYQEYIGRTLSRWEVVHHKDGNTRNNKIENLELMSLAEHSSMHGKARKGKVSKDTKDKLRAINIANVPAEKVAVVKEIKKMLAKGVRSANIARTFKVSNYTVYRIKAGITYSYIKID